MVRQAETDSQGKKTNMITTGERWDWEINQEFETDTYILLYMK